MNAELIRETVKQYHLYKKQLWATEKAVPINSRFRHISGIEVEATAVVKGWFSLETDCVKIKSAIIPTSLPTEKAEDLEIGWLTIVQKINFISVFISLEEFLALPDWDSSLEKLECKVLPNMEDLKNECDLNALESQSYEG